MSTTNLSNLAFALGSWANRLPALWRKRIYQTVKVVSGLLTLFLLVAPSLPGLLGANWDPNDRYTALATAALAFLGHLADRNTVVPDVVDVTPAPESSAGMSEPSVSEPAPAATPAVSETPNPAVSPPHKS